MNYQQQIKLRAWLRRPLWTYAFLGIQTAVFLMMELFPRLEIPYYAAGTPAPGGGIPSSALGDFMRGMAGTWVYANRNEFDADDWF